MDYRELTTRSTTQEATLSNSIGGGIVKSVGDRRARVVQHYALIIATQKLSGDRKKVVSSHGLTSVGAGGCESYEDSREQEVSGT
jgi:urease beta subunit